MKEQRKRITPAAPRVEAVGPAWVVAMSKQEEM